MADIKAYYTIAALIFQLNHTRQGVFYLPEKVGLVEKATC